MNGPAQRRGSCYAVHFNAVICGAHPVICAAGLGIGRAVPLNAGVCGTIMKSWFCASQPSRSTPDYVALSPVPMNDCCAVHLDVSLRGTKLVRVQRNCGAAHLKVISFVAPRGSTLRRACRPTRPTGDISARAAEDRSPRNVIPSPREVAPRTCWTDDDAAPTRPLNAKVILPTRSIGGGPSQPNPCARAA